MWIIQSQPNFKKSFIGVQLLGLPKLSYLVFKLRLKFGFYRFTEAKVGVVKI